MKTNSIIYAIFILGSIFAPIIAIDHEEGKGGGITVVISIIIFSTLIITSVIELVKSSLRTEYSFGDFAFTLIKTWAVIMVIFFAFMSLTSFS